MVALGRMLTSKNIWVLANLVCTAILAIQLANVLEGFIKPTITRTWEEELPLEDMEFPVVIKICVIPGLNETELHGVGYRNAYAYFVGQSRFNKSVFGWAGHTQDSRTFGNVEEIIQKVTTYGIENIFTQIYVWTRDEDFPIEISFKHLKAKANFPNNCRSLTLSRIPELERKPIQSLHFKIRDLGTSTVEIHFNGDTLECRRNIKEHSLQSIGDAIRVMHKNVWRAYIVDITQRVFAEEDPANTCRDYPNEEYLSYEECDNQFVKSLLPVGLTPVWMTDHYAEVSTHVFDENETFHIGQIFSCKYFIFHIDVPNVQVKCTT